METQLASSLPVLSPLLSFSQGGAVQTSDKTAHTQSRRMGLGHAEGDHKHTNSLCFLSICA